MIEVVPDLNLVALFAADITDTDAPVEAASYASVPSQVIGQVETG